MGAPNRGKKICAELCRLLWVVLAPLVGYMISAKQGGEKKCGGLAMIARLWNYFSNKLYISPRRRILLPAPQTAIKRMTVILVMPSSPRPPPTSFFSFFPLTSICRLKHPLSPANKNDQPIACCTLITASWFWWFVRSQAPHDYLLAARPATR